MLVSMSVDIDATPAEVWEHLVDPEKAKAWFTALKKYEWASDERGVGADFYWYEEASGRTYNIWFTTTEWVPGEVFGYTMTKGDFFKSYDERWEIEHSEPGTGGEPDVFTLRAVQPAAPKGALGGVS